jgi:CubicO group peptidase (beta-lactamase class C family)
MAGCNSLRTAVKQGELKLDNPVANYVGELAQGADIRRVTLGQLASHTSGLPRNLFRFVVFIVRSA